MKVVLIYPHGGMTPKSPPLGLLNLKAVLDQSGIPCSVVYVSNKFKCVGSPEAFQKNILKVLDNEISDDTVCCGFSVMTGLQIFGALSLSAIIKSRYPKIKIVWGGVHPTLIPEQTIMNDNIDIVCKGEFENNIVDLVNAISSGSELDNVHNIYFKKNGNVVKTDDSCDLVDLNRIPFVDYSKVDNSVFECPFPDNFYRFKSKKIANVEFTRGCPLSCYYCVQNKFRTKFRFMKTDMVIESLRRIKKSGFEAVIIVDDNFYINPNATETVRAIKDENLGLELYVSIPVTKLFKMCDEDFVLLSEAGFTSLGISVESGSDRMLKIMGKKHNIDMVMKVNKKLSSYGFVCNYNFIAGFPEENLDDIISTFDLMMELSSDNLNAISNIKKLLPTPNTDVYRSCVNRGMSEPKKLEDWCEVVDLEWRKCYNYIDNDVERFYKSMRVIISDLTQYSYSVDMNPKELNRILFKFIINKYIKMKGDFSKKLKH